MPTKFWIVALRVENMQLAGAQGEGLVSKDELATADGKVGVSTLKRVTERRAVSLKSLLLKEGIPYY